MYRLNQADKLYYYKHNSYRGGVVKHRNKVVIGEYPTVKDAALKLKEMRKLHPDKVFYVVPAWNKHKSKRD